MTLMVTGGVGLLGHAVLSRLSGRAHPLVGFDRVDPGPGRLPGVIYVGGDLTVLPDVEDAARRHGVRRIVHAGARSYPGMAAQDRLGMYQVNLAGTVNVLEVARRTGVERVVYISSGAVYGRTPPDHLIEEEQPLEPATHYGVTKAAGEMVAQAYRVQEGLDVVVLRMSSLYGARRRTPSVISYLLAHALEGKPAYLEVPTATEDFLYITDAARAVERAVEVSSPPHHTYNVASGRRFSHGEVAELVQALFPAWELRRGGSGTPPAEVERGPIDVSRIRDDLGFGCEVHLEDGLQLMMKEMQAHPEVGQRDALRPS